MEPRTTRCHSLPSPRAGVLGRGAAYDVAVVTVTPVSAAVAGTVRRST